MWTHESIPRSPLLMGQHDSVLLVVDVQVKLAPLVRSPALLEWNIRRLLDGAQTLAIPRLAAEQYPRGLGSTLPEIRSRLVDVPSKLTFSCAGCPELVAQLRQHHRPKILVAGIETHVCVLQTVCDLMTEGYQLFVAVDAVSARRAVDHETALRRLEASGVTLTSTEAVLFEWCEKAGSETFRAIRRLALETPPEQVTAAERGVET